MLRRMKWLPITMTMLMLIPAAAVAAEQPAPGSKAQKLLERLKQAEDPALAEKLREQVQQAWIAEGPMSAQVLLKEATSAQASGLVETAERLLRLAVRRWPDYAEARFRLAFLLWQTGRETEALRVLDALLQRKPEHFPALSLKVRLLLEQQKLREALKSCQILQRQLPRWRQWQRRCQRLQWRVGQDA